jgi:hypothetical protein
VTGVVVDGDARQRGGLTPGSGEADEILGKLMNSPGDLLGYAAPPGVVGKKGGEDTMEHPSARTRGNDNRVVSGEKVHLRIESLAGLRAIAVVEVRKGTAGEALGDGDLRARALDEVDGRLSHTGKITVHQAGGIKNDPLGRCLVVFSRAMFPRAMFHQKILVSIGRHAVVLIGG